MEFYGISGIASEVVHKLCLCFSLNIFYKLQDQGLVKTVRCARVALDDIYGQKQKAVGRPPHCLEQAAFAPVTTHGKEVKDTAKTDST